MNRADCYVGQRVKIKPGFEYNKHLDGMTGFVKELPLGFVIVQIEVPILIGEIEPVGIGPEEKNERGDKP